MIDIVLGSSHHGTGGNTFSTPRTLCPVFPEEIFSTENFIVFDKTFISERLSTGGAGETLGVPGLVHHLQDESVKDHSSA